MNNPVRTLPGRGSPDGAQSPYHEDMATPTIEQVTAALATVNDPEIRRPITELDMIKNVDIAADGSVLVSVYLTVAGCPLRDKITADVTGAVSKVPGVASVRVDLDVMSEDQRKA